MTHRGMMNMYKKPTDADRAAGRAMLKSGAKKTMGAVKSYGKNVAGGAKMVGGAVKRAATRLFK